MVFLRGRTREECLPNLETTTPGRENRAADADSILRHARERKQSLCGDGELQRTSESLRGGVGRGAHARAIRKSRCCRCLPLAFDRVEIPLAGVSTPPAIPRSALL